MRERNGNNNQEEAQQEEAGHGASQVKASTDKAVKRQWRRQVLVPPADKAKKEHNNRVREGKRRRKVWERDRERVDVECIGSQVELNLLPVLPAFCLCFC